MSLPAASETCTAYLAPDQFLEQLLSEVRAQRPIVKVHGQLVLALGEAINSAWAQNIWHEARCITIDSIADAARILKGIQRNWWPYAHELHRRTQLIQEKLPHVKAKPLDFPERAPTAPLGSYALLDKNTMIYAAHCSSPFPNGEARFVEHKSGPPSRAYLKLFEALTRHGRYPGPGESCLELGACPGGWTWVLARLGAQVTAYDRAPLDPAIAALPNVRYVKGDAFSARPEKVGKVDWLLSDVICYPQRLYEHVMSWIDADACRNIIVTVKFQGQDHYDVIPKFQAIANSQLFHSFHNKHELTWAWFSAESTDSTPSTPS